MSLYRKLYKFVVGHSAIRKASARMLFWWRHSYMFMAGRIHGIDRKKVVFSSFQASAYNDNPRYISEKLHELDPSIKQVWLFREEKFDSVQLPEYIVKAHVMRRDGLRHLATARAWVDNMQKNQSFYLDEKRQLYFNTWHGDRGFKRVGKDNEKSTERLPRLERKCAGMIAGSEFGRGTYRTAFGYQGEVLMDGCPRNDILMRNDPDEAAEIRRRMGIPENWKLMVFAPTFRDDAHSAQHAQLDILKTLDLLEAHTGDKWVCLLRTHYRSMGIDVNGMKDRIINMTHWPEMAEILMISDLLISDYSSCAGDFILRDKPAILYHADAAEYNSGSREFYFDMSTAPFWIARDMDELAAVIRNINDETILENCRQWREFFKVTETGHAAEASARFLLERM